MHIYSTLSTEHVNCNNMCQPSYLPTYTHSAILEALSGCLRFEKAHSCLLYTVIVMSEIPLSPPYPECWNNNTFYSTFHTQKPVTLSGGSSIHNVLGHFLIPRLHSNGLCNQFTISISLMAISNHMTLYGSYSLSSDVSPLGHNLVM